MKRKILSLMVILGLFAGLAIISSGCGNKASDEPKKLNLFVCAGMKKPMDVVIEKFKQETGNEVIVNYGPSGGLYAQIKEGQPCDLYYSADYLYIEKLQNEDQKLAEGKKFMKDNVVLVVSKQGKEKVKSVNDLVKKGVVLAVADPKAPIGVYSENALKKMGLWDQINASGNLKARPSTVNQIAIMVKNDEVDAGLIFSSVANGNGLEPVEVLSDTLTGEIIFSAGIIKGGNTKLADDFYNTSVKYAEEFTKYGWRVYE